MKEGDLMVRNNEVRNDKSIFIVNPDGTAPALYVNGLSIHTPGLQGIFEKDLSNQLKRHCDLFHTNF